MTYITSDLIVVAPLIFFILLIAFPIIGAFAGWKRALYWGIGNLSFYLLGLAIWKLAGYNISNTIGSLFRYYQEKFGMNPDDLTRLVNAEVVVSYFCLILIIANVLLTIFYFVTFKKLAGLAKPKQQDMKLKRGKWVKIRHRNDKPPFNQRFANAFIGAWSMTILMLPISATFSHGMYFCTTTTMTRSNAPLNNALYYGFQQTLSKPYLNWATYYTSETGNDFDAIYCLHQLYESNVSYPDVHAKFKCESAILATNKSIMETIQCIVEAMKDPTVSTASRTSIEKLTTVFTNTTNTLKTIYKESKYDLGILYKSSAMACAMHNYMINYEGFKTIKLTNDEVEQKFKGYDNFCTKMLEIYKNGRIICDDYTEVVFKNFSNVTETSSTAYNYIKQWVLEGFDLSDLTDENKAIMNYQIGELTRIIINDQPQEKS